MVGRPRLKYDSALQRSRKNCAMAIHESKEAMTGKVMRRSTERSTVVRATAMRALV